ncbi:hypothetical protein, partial [Paucihalobacter sp.]|uniref:hypothetical protein n=1 Tax=Paucihalobacter sp. TaxID=2850405 RepID=UPI002FDFA380
THFGNFGFQHYKKITNETDTGDVKIVDYEWSYNDPLTEINFVTVFGTQHFFPTNGLKLKDVRFKDSDFFNYSNRLKYYNKIVIKDFIYVLITWLLLMLIVIFFKNFKIKLN